MHNPNQILDTLAKLITDARSTTPGGVLMEVDMQGLYRRAGHTHHMTPDRVRELHEAGTASRHRPRHPATNIGE